MNIVDALVVTFGLDPAEFKRGSKVVADGQKKQREDSDETTKRVQNNNKKQAESFRSVTREVLGLLAAVGATVGLKQFLLGTMDSQANLGRMATNLRMNARELRAWGIVAEEMGGKAEDAYSSLQNLATGLAEAAKAGHSALTDSAYKNGINLFGQDGRVVSYEEALKRISARMRGVDRQVAMTVFNEMGVGALSNQLLLGPQELDKRLAHAAGLVRITKESTEQAQELQRRWADMQARFEGIRDAIWNRLAPSLLRLADRLADWLDSVDWDKVGRGIENAVNWVVRLVEALGGLKTVLAIVATLFGLKMLGGLVATTAQILRLVPVIGTITAGFGALATAVAAAAGALAGYLVYDKLLAGTKAGDTIGRATATVMAAMGSDTAQEALARDGWSSLTEEQRRGYIDRYKALSPGARAAYDRAFPGLSAIIRGQIGTTAAGGGSAASGASTAGLPRGVRNNNPGNLNFAGQPGATLESGPGARFASFQTMGEGIQQLSRQLGLYAIRGNDTISGIINTYAPSKDNNNTGAYIRDVAGQTGMDPNAHLNLADPAVMQSLIRAIINHEGNGKYVSDEDIRAGIRLNMGGVGVGAGSSGAGQRTGGVGGVSTTEVHINKLEVITPATDARGIARDIGGELRNHLLVTQANTGLS